MLGFLVHNYLMLAMKTQKLISLLTACLVMSCRPTKVDQQLEHALVLAKSNRVELEKALDHYSHREADSLKLKAARFLIRNMPGHVSYTGKNIERYYAEAAPILASDKSQKDKEKLMNELMKKYPASSLQEVQDVEIITADYLIANIESAFRDWQEGLWAQHLTFDEFCEYLLPYKCADYQALDDWRSTLRQISEDKLKNYRYNQIYRNSAYHAARIVNTELDNRMSVKVSDKLKSHSLFKVPFWTQIPSASCGTYATISTAAMRSTGIPAANDVILHWASGYLDHSWVTVFMESGNKVHCEGCHGGVFGHVRPGEYKGKIYRRTYAPVPDLIRLNQEAGHVPSALRTWFLKDVTEEYVNPVSFTVAPLKEQLLPNEKYAYVAVFGDRDWTIIGFCRIEDNRITFDRLERNVVYLPCYYTAQGMQPLSYPVLMDKQGKEHVLRPDTLHRREVCLQRKYFVARAAYQRGLLMEGGMFQAAQKPDFSDAVTLHTFQHLALSGTVNIQDTTAYRYWRYYNPNDTHCNMAEIEFFTEGRHPLKGTIIGSPDKDPGRHTRAAAFDRKPLTFFESEPGPRAWVGMDFGHPVRMTEIDYLIRSDGNNVWKGDIYELFYWDTDGWTSLGRQKATRMSVTYRNVPQNALLLLRDITEGNNERIFLYKNGEQIWY